eukprot:PhF_6_TR37063/c0_g1_i1/m.54281
MHSECGSKNHKKNKTIEKHKKKGKWKGICNVVFFKKKKKVLFLVVVYSYFFFLLVLYPRTQLRIEKQYTQHAILCPVQRERIGFQNKTKNKNKNSFVTLFYVRERQMER